MPTFLYLGYNAQGQRTGGSLLCDNIAQAERALDELNIADYEVYTTKTDFNGRAAIGAAELEEMFHYAIGSLAMGVSSAERFEALARRTPNPQLKIAAEEISGFVRRGYYYTNALLMYGHIFEPLLVRVVIAGDTVGRQSQACADLGEFYAWEARVQAMLRRFFIVQVFSALSLIFRVLPDGRLRADSVLAKLPPARPVIMALCSARIARGAALLLKYGSMVNAALPFLPSLVQNRAVQAKLTRIAEQIRAGQEPVSVLEISRYYPPYFPPEMYNLATKGFKDNSLERRMQEAAEIFGAEAERLIKRVGFWLRPAVIAAGVIMAGLIIFYFIW